MDDFACTLAVCTLCFILVASLWLVPDVGKDLPLPFQRDWDLCSSSLPVSLTPVFFSFYYAVKKADSVFHCLRKGACALPSFRMGFS